MDHANNSLRILDAAGITVPDDVRFVISRHMDEPTQEEFDSWSEVRKVLFACFTIADVFECGNNYYKQAGGYYKHARRFEEPYQTISFMKNIKFKGRTYLQLAIDLVEKQILVSDFISAVLYSRSPIEQPESSAQAKPRGPPSAAPVCIVSVPENAPDGLVHVLRDMLGPDIGIVRGRQVAEKTAAEKRTAVIVIDETITADMLRDGRLKQYVSAISVNKFLRENDILLTLNEVTIKDKTRQELSDILSLIVANLKKIEKAKAEDIPALRADMASRVSGLPALIDRRRSELAAVYNNAPIAVGKDHTGTVAIATTESVAENDLYLVENMKKASENGVANCFIYGKRLKTPEEAMRFLQATGFIGDPSSITLVNMNDYKTYEDLVGRISAVTGAKAGSIGIRSTVVDGIVRRSKEEVFEAKIIEIAPLPINNEDYYVTIDTYQALLKLVTDFSSGMVLDSILPGLIQKDGIIKYLPRSVPIDYYKELDMYKKAVDILRQAA